MTKTFVTINDKRWDAHKIDFAYVVGVAMLVANKNDKIQNLIDDANKINTHTHRLYGHLMKPFGDLKREISIVLINDKEIQILNKEYRNKNKPTNVLSFETGDAEMLGDIFISYDTVMRESKSENKSFHDHAVHMVVHGVLHLLGYDHLNDADADLMENLEIKILQKLKIKNPYLESSEFRVQSSDKKVRNQKSFWCSLMPVWMLIAGALASFGFAPYYIGIATVLGFIALYIFSYKRIKFWRGYSVGFWFGVGYGTCMFYWMLNSIFVDPVIAEQMRAWFIPGLIGIALASGVIFGLPSAIMGFINNKIAPSPREGGWRRVVLFATIWTIILYFREWLLTGFPWNPIANITMPVPIISNSMSLFGALGLSFIIFGLIFSIAHILSESREPKTENRKQRFYPFYIFIPLLIAGMVWGYININKSENGKRETPVFRIVQPAQNQSSKLSRESADENVAHLIDLSIDPAYNGMVPDIIVWPETAYPYMVVGDEFPAAKSVGKFVVAGAMSMDVHDFYAADFMRARRVKNSMIIANGDGKILKIYDKSHLVPFGEYRPFGDIVPTPGQLVPGVGSEIINIGDNCNFAPAICYEIIFSDSLVPKNTDPDFILNITNDTWFGTSHGPYQHLDMVRRYAIESGLPIVRANYSGISAFVSADGKILSSIGIGQTGFIDGRVSGAHITPYRIIGLNWMMIIILSFSILVVTPKPGRRLKD